MFAAIGANTVSIAALYAVSFPAVKRAQGSSQTVQPVQLAASAATGGRIATRKIIRTAGPGNDRADDVIRWNKNRNITGT